MSSHFSFGPAPHVGQAVARTCSGLGFLAFMAVDNATNRKRKNGQFCTPRLAFLYRLWWAHLET